jgi:uncharacterized membrane protein HdeD (DUF308 family)
MSSEAEKIVVAGEKPCHELAHLRSGWWWFLALGALLAIGGAAAIIVPAFTVTMSFVAVVVLGIVLMASGIATIIGAFWAGKWSGLLLQMMVGILYVMAGFMISDAPGRSALVMTLFFAALFIVLGAFRIVAALLMRFPQWGWGLLNGVVTLLAGIVIYRHFPESTLWVIGILVGVEMLLNGWTWIMLALALRNLPQQTA